MKMGRIKKRRVTESCRDSKKLDNRRSLNLSQIFAHFVPSPPIVNYHSSAKHNSDFDLFNRMYMKIYVVCFTYPDGLHGLAALLYSAEYLLPFSSYRTGHHHNPASSSLIPVWQVPLLLAPPSSIRGPVCLLIFLQPSARSAPTNLRRCCGPGPEWTAGSGSSY